MKILAAHFLWLVGDWLESARGAMLELAGRLVE